MPRMQVYLPDELHAAVKARELPVSEILQGALRAELRRLDLLAETDRYLAALTDDVGAPSPAQRKQADLLARKIARRSVGSTG